MTTPERLINIFAYGNETHVHSMGWKAYERKGNDKDLFSFLHSRASIDHKTAERIKIRESIKWEKFNSMNRLNGTINILISYGLISDNDLYCITPIVNGNAIMEDIKDALYSASIPDYLKLYMTEDGFDFPNLIDDDYFKAIRILWNEKKYISCLKLVFSAVDTFGFVEYGDSGNGFTKWLDEFCDLQSIGVTSKELWELRNSLVHMTNLLSRKVIDGSVRQLIPSIASIGAAAIPSTGNSERFHVARFIIVILPKGIENWLVTYNKDREKISQFIDRYDTVISEARLVVSYRVDGEYSSWHPRS